MTDLSGKTVGRYQLLQRLGQGAMAQVYRALDPTSGREVAIKILHPHLTADEGFVDRFRREAQAAASLDHPHIVRILDHGSDGDLSFLVMELVDVIAIGDASFTFRDPDATLETSCFPRLVVDEADGDIWVDRRPVQLSPKQQALFSLLWRRRGRVCSKDEIAHAVWPECQGEIYDYQIESLVKRLRAKLEPDPAHPTLLVTVRGRGYRLLP